MIAKREFPPWRNHAPLLGAIYYVDRDGAMARRVPDPPDIDVWVNIVATVVTILMAAALAVLWWGLHS